MVREIYEKNKYYIIIGVIILLTSISFVLIYNYETVENEISENIISINENIEVVKEDSLEQYFYVDIKGAINKPNVYKVTEDSRIIDVIKLAGGLTNKADTSVLNLSKKVSDEMVIIIYTKDEINNFKKDNKNKEEIIKYIEKDCKCPDPNINGACNKNSDVIEDKVNTKISLNNATKEELMTLPGIGESKALDIINYRNNGLFKSIEDLKNVSGIGESTFNQIKDLITL